MLVWGTARQTYFFSDGRPPSNCQPARESDTLARGSSFTTQNPSTSPRASLVQQGRRGRLHGSCLRLQGAAPFRTMGRAAMPAILAIVSKAVFEKDAQQGGERLGLGDTLPLDRYHSSNRALEPLGGGGRLFLVTVRPPDERLWLVAVLDGPAFRDGAWIAAAPNRVPLTDISALRGTLRFTSGKGISPDKGALGMSLQTPRVLADADVAQLLAAFGGGGAPVDPLEARVDLTPAALELLAALAKSPRDEALRERAARRLMAEGALAEVTRVLTGTGHLNAHNPSGLPCLCKACLVPDVTEVTAGGVTFARDFVIKEGRALFFWAPQELFADANGLRNSVRGSLRTRLARLAKSRKRRVRTPF